MITYFWQDCPTLICAAAAFLLTIIGIAGFSRFLPKDQGRQFAVNGSLSQGKPRGAGLILILAFTAAAILFLPLHAEYCIYLAAIFVEMLSGYLDDASEKPWGELKKGLIDLAVAVVVSYTVYHYHGGEVILPILGITFTVPMALYIVLGIILIWASINVTNCADGVDGLCTSVSLVTLMGSLTAAVLLGKEMSDSSMAGMVWMMAGVLLAYLWFNCSPSRLLMGDAGSRALGLLLAAAFMVFRIPFLFIPMALVLIFDGGLGLVKLTIIRVCKAKNFMKNLRTPLHDHARKNMGWSDTQVVTRFTLFQILLTAAAVGLMRIS